MSDYEITRSYLEAADRKLQIKILSELNCCEEASIFEILGKEGASTNIFPAKGEVFRERMELYNRGLSDSEIGTRTGRDASSIRKWRKLRGLPPNYPRGGRAFGKKMQRGT